MKCIICGKEITDYGNNPYPICQREDTSSKCCNDCNSNYVIGARLVSTKGKMNTYIDAYGNDLIKPNDSVIIFYSVNSDEPLNHLIDTGYFLVGHVEEIDLEYKQLCGTWGNFTIDLEKDTYCIINE